MDLKDFVRDSLTQISEGVRAAQDSVRQHGGYASPAVYGRTAGEAHFGTLDHGQNVFLVDFDVAVTVMQGSASDVEGRLKVASVFGAGGGRKTTGSEEYASRLRFKVPLALPVDEQTKATLEHKRQQADQQARASRDDFDRF